MATVVLFDTFSLVFRAFFALPDMRTADGRPTAALYGFSTLLLKVLREHSPTGMAFALDAPERTFRQEAYAEYKAQRERAPTPLVEQLSVLGTLLEATGVPRFRAPGFEADDVLATLAQQISVEHDVLIVSGDRDLFQTIGPRVRVLFAGQRGKAPVLVDEAAFHKRFGIAPAQYKTYIALVGDTSDNIPGVPGVGPRTAARWIVSHGDVAGILAHLEELTPARLRDDIAGRADWLVAAEELARLRTDVALPDGPRFAALDDAAYAALAERYEALEFKSLLPRLAALREA